MHGMRCRRPRLGRQFSDWDGPCHAKQVRAADGRLFTRLGRCVAIFRPVCAPPPRARPLRGHRLAESRAHGSCLRPVCGHRFWWNLAGQPVCGCGSCESARGCTRRCVAVAGVWQCAGAPPVCGEGSWCLPLPFCPAHWMMGGRPGAAGRAFNPLPPTGAGARLFRQRVGTIRGCLHRVQPKRAGGWE